MARTMTVKEDLYLALEEEASRSSRTVSDLVAEALETWLADCELDEAEHAEVEAARAEAAEAGRGRVREVLRRAEERAHVPTPMTTLPNPDRPRMTPTYGVGDPQYGFEPIEWSWVVERMTEARSYWGRHHPRRRSSARHTRLGSLGKRRIPFLYGHGFAQGPQHPPRPEGYRPPRKRRRGRHTRGQLRGGLPIAGDGLRLRVQVRHVARRRFAGRVQAECKQGVGVDRERLSEDRHPLALRARSLTIYEDLTITDGDRLCDMLRADDIFRNCEFRRRGLRRHRGGLTAHRKLHAEAGEPDQHDLPRDASVRLESRRSKAG